MYFCHPVHQTFFVFMHKTKSKMHTKQERKRSNFFNPSSFFNFVVLFCARKSQLIILTKNIYHDTCYNYLCYKRKYVITTV
jgi:hypothetical protein